MDVSFNYNKNNLILFFPQMVKWKIGETNVGNHFFLVRKFNQIVKEIIHKIGKLLNINLMVIFMFFFSFNCTYIFMYLLTFIFTFD